MHSGLFFVLDVESIGLYGEGFAAGFCVVNINSVEVQSGLYSCDPGKADGGAEGRLWVSNNVPQLVHNERNPYEVRRQISEKIEYWKKWGAIICADCSWPVEANFLLQCVSDKLLSGVYQFHDIASIMLAKGMDPTATYDRKPTELPVHNPLCDARQSARLLIEALRNDK